MTVLIIIAAIIGTLILLTNFPVTAHIRFYGGKADVKVKYLFLPLYPRPPKSKGKRSRKEKPPDGSEESSPEEAPPGEEAASDKEETAEKDVTEEEPIADSEDEKPEKQSLPEKLSALIDDLTGKKNAFQTLWELIWKPLKSLLGKVRIHSVIIDFAAADEDAAKAAVLYGSMNAAVYNILGQLQCITPVKVKSVTIDCLYNTPSSKTRYDGEMKVILRPASVLNAITAVLFGYLINSKKYSPALKILTKK